MAMKVGELRLRWDDRHGTHLYQDHPCLNDALNHAGVVVSQGGTLTRLENWLGEDAGPLKLITSVAEMRAKDHLIVRSSERAREAMEATPGYGTF